MPMPELRQRAAALARMATLAKVPVITTASVPQGPNGPLIPEIHENAPHAKYVARRGEVNAWDKPDFVAAVEATGRRSLIIAGTITSVCMAFPAISAVNAGYKVFAVLDASGTYSKMAEEITLARILQAGVVPMDTAAVASELQKTWNRNDAQEWAGVYTRIFPNYQLLIESYMRAQKVAVDPRAARLPESVSHAGCRGPWCGGRPSPRGGLRITGGIGNDRLYGDAGHDQVAGGAGNDPLYWGRGQRRDARRGRATISFSAVTATTSSLVARATTAFSAMRGPTCSAAGPARTSSSSPR